MIDEGRTLEIYGYTSDELKPKSVKTIVAVCEECGKYRDVRKSAYHDLCNSCSHLGITFSPEHRQKLSDANKGKTVTPETLQKMKRMTGENSPNWKGGITPVMQMVRHSHVYKNWRAAVYDRDDFTCQMCDVRGGNLEAHHINPVRDHKNDLLIFDVDNGVTLCKRCHRVTKGHEHDFIERFEDIIRGGRR